MEIGNFLFIHSLAVLEDDPVQRLTSLDGGKKNLNKRLHQFCT
jgi:hypothetical protein